ncbi:MAG: hypothetical protein V4721_16450 [Bacteroidota bacterium]
MQQYPLNVNDTVLSFFMDQTSDRPLKNDLERVRNRYALRVHRGISKKIIQHKHSRSFYMWLELKPLFIDSIIRAEEETEGGKTSDPKLPYEKIAGFLKVGISTVRMHFRILKKYKLIKYDQDRNIHFASYEIFAAIFRHTEIRKYKLANNGETQFILKKIAVFESLAKQDYMKRQKMFYRELFNILYERSRDSQLAQVSGLTNNTLNRLYHNNKECANFFPKGELKKHRKHFNKYFDLYEEKYQKVFKAQIQQLSLGFPDLNMQVTLSQGGLSRLFGKEDGKQTCGQYQKKLLVDKKMLFVEGEYQYINDQSPAIYEKTMYGRSDIFSYKYFYRREARTVEKFFRNMPDTVRPVFPERFIQDNFRWKDTKSRICTLIDRKTELPLYKC